MNRLPLHVLSLLFPLLPSPFRYTQKRNAQFFDLAHVDFSKTKDIHMNWVLQLQKARSAPTPLEKMIVAASSTLLPGGASCSAERVNTLRRAEGELVGGGRRRAGSWPCDGYAPGSRPCPKPLDRRQVARGEIEEAWKRTISRTTQSSPGRNVAG